MEVRYIAYSSKDPQFIADYEAKKDIYTELAKMCLPNATPEEIKRERGFFKSTLLG